MHDMNATHAPTPTPQQPPYHPQGGVIGIYTYIYIARELDTETETETKRERERERERKKERERKAYLDRIMAQSLYTITYYSCFC